MTDYAILDSNKPRFRCDRGSLTKLVSIKFFKKFKAKYKDSNIDSFHKMREVLKAIHTRVTDVVATERTGFDLAALANFVTVAYTPSIKAMKEDFEYVNYKLSREHGKRIKHLNLHTDGKACRIFFSMSLRKYKFTYKDLWSFRPTQPFSRKVSKEFAKDYTRFIMLEPGDSLRKVFQNALT